MTSIADISTLVDANLRAGWPPFAGTPLDNLAILTALDPIVDLRGGFRASHEPGSDACIVTGTTTVLGMVDVTVTCTFSQPAASRVQFDLRAELPAHAALPLPGLPQSPLSGMFLDVAVGGVDAWLQSVLWSVGGTLGTGGAALDFTLRASLDGETWQLTARPHDKDAWKLEAAATLLGAGDLLARLPSKLSSLDLVLSGVEADFDPQAKAIPRLAAYLASTQPWPLITPVSSKGVAIEDVRLTLTVLDLGIRTPPSFAATLEGRIASIPIVIETVDTPTHVLIGIAPGARVPLAGLSDLAHLIGGDTPLPRGLDVLKALTLSDLEVEIDLVTPALERTAVGIELDGPWDVGSIVHFRKTRLGLEVANPFSPAVDVSGYFSTWADLGDTSAYVTGTVTKQAIAVAASIERIDLTALVKQLLPGFELALPSKNEIKSVSFTYATGTGLRIEAETSINLFDLARAVGIPLPLGFHSLDLKGIVFEESGGEVSLTVRADTEIEFPSGSSRGVKVTDFEIAVHRDAKGGVTTAGSFTLDLAVTFSPDFKIEAGTASGLRCSWDGATKNWSVQGDVQATLFGVALPGLTAGFTREGDLCHFTLSCPGPVSLVPAWTGVGAVNVKGITLSVAHDDVSNTYDWIVGAGVDFSIGSLFDGHGTLAFDKTGDTWTVSAVARGPWTPSIALGPATTTLTVESVAFKTGSSADATYIEADGIAMSVSGLPSPIDRCLPADVHGGTLRCDSAGVSIIFDTDFSIPFPSLEISLPDGSRKVLGRPSIGLTRFRIDVGSNSELTGDLTVGAQELNALFGTAPGGQPLLRKSFAVSLGISPDGIVFSFVDSPFNALQFYEPEDDPGHRWFDWNLPECGSFSVRVPTFSFAGGAFTAGAGIQRHGDIRLPLGWLKALLGAMAGELGSRGVPEQLIEKARLAIPDSVPLTGLDLDAALGTLATFLSADPELQPLADAVRRIEEQEQRLPARLRQYLDMKLPESIVLDISVEADGGFSFAFTAGGDPLRLLLPGGGGLTGLTVTSASAGLCLGGTLVKAGIDIEVDSYDFITLAVALLKGGAGDFVDHLVVGKSLWLAPTAFPLPIPVFYDPIEWEYKGLLGEAHLEWRFPKPSVTATALVQVLTSLYRFATVKEQALDPQFIPDSCNPRFELGPAYLVPPSFLDSGRLTVNEETRELSISQSLAVLLNAFKFLDLVYVIEAIPLKSGDNWVRIGKGGITFGPLQVDAAWCVATDKEYREQILTDRTAREVLAVADPEGALTLLAAAGPPLDRGFVVLLMGDTSLAGFIGYDVQFGSALTDAGLQTRARLQSHTACVTSCIEGDVLSGKPDVQGERSTTIHGHASLSVGPLTLLDSDAKVGVVPGQRFETQVRLKFGPFCWIDGLWTISTSGMRVDGTATWQYSQALTFSEQAGVEFSATGVEMHFDLTLPLIGGATVSFSVGAEGLNVTLTPHFTLPWWLSSLRAATDAAEQDIVSLAAVQSNWAALGNVEVSLNGIRKALPGMCQGVIASMDAAITEGVNARWSDLYSPVVSRQQLIDDAKKDLEEVYGVFQRLSAAAGSTDDEGLRRALNAELRTLIANRHVVVKAHVHAFGKDVVDFPIWEGDLLDRGDVQRLLLSLQTLNYLPAQSATTAGAGQIYTALLNKKKALAPVRQAVAEGRPPAITSIRLLAPLEQLTAGTAVEVTTRYGGKDHVFRSSVNLLDAAQPGQLASAFLRTL